MFGIKKMLKNRKAQVGTMELVISVAIGLIVLAAIFSLAPVIGDKVDSAVTISQDAYATGELTFTGNTTDGELINISTDVFEFDTDASYTHNQIDVSSGNNNSSRSATLFAAAVESVGNFTGADVSGSVVTLTADTVGSAGNSITIASDCANLTKPTTLTGGTDASEWADDDVPTGVDIWKDNATLISLVVLVMIISLAIFYIRRMGGGGGGA